jgi:hypothetical protein
MRVGVETWGAKREMNVSRTQWKVTSFNPAFRAYRTKRSESFFGSVGKTRGPVRQRPRIDALFTRPGVQSLPSLHTIADRASEPCPVITLPFELPVLFLASKLCKGLLDNVLALRLVAPKLRHHESH